MKTARKTKTVFFSIKVNVIKGDKFDMISLDSSLRDVTEFQKLPHFLQTQKLQICSMETSRHQLYYNSCWLIV